MIHEHTDDLYTFEECKQELLEDGLINENEEKNDKNAQKNRKMEGRKKPQL